MNQTVQRVKIIAEVGVNHNGDLELAKEIVDAISETDVDVIKFQTFQPALLLAPDAPKAKYQFRSTLQRQSAFQMLSSLSFSFEEFSTLKTHVELKGKTFLSTAFDMPSLDFLSNLGLRLYKIPSGEITNLPYLRAVAELADELIISTGMSDMGEIEAALNVITAAGFDLKNITVLQCNTAYPTPIADVNLRAMVTMRTSFGVNVGFSDHTVGIAASSAAVALGATVIEKHVTLNKNLPGPDHLASMEPEEFALLVQSIREVEAALGSNEKVVTESERENIPLARRSLYAARDIPTGTRLQAQDIIALRPEAGLSPMLYDSVIDSISTRPIKKHEALTTENVSIKL